MSPNAALTDFLAHYCDKNSIVEDEVNIPDTTLGDSQFQDGQRKTARRINSHNLL